MALRVSSGALVLTLEPLLGVQVDLLGLSNVLEDLLNDRAIPISRVTVTQGGVSFSHSSTDESIRT